jgi:hypothetical protein
LHTAGAMHSAPQLDSQGEQVGGHGVATVRSERMGHTVGCVCVCVDVCVYVCVCVFVCVCFLCPEGVCARVSFAAVTCPFTITGTRRRRATETWRVHRHKFSQVSICVVDSVNIPRALTCENFGHLRTEHAALYSLLPTTDQRVGLWHFYPRCVLCRVLPLCYRLGRRVFAVCA